MKFLMDFETGIAREKIFQEGKHILYIGEPTDLEVATLEWVYGKFASAMHVEAIFRKRLEILSAQLITEMNSRLSDAWISAEEKTWLATFHDAFMNTYVTSQKISVVKDFQDHAEHWKKLLTVATELPTGITSPIADISVAVCSYGYRGFHDIGLWNTTIVPRLQIMRKEMIRQGIIYDQVDENLSSWEEVYLGRFKPKTEKDNPNIKQTVFPQIPVRDHTYDRIIASWSMSTHAFGGMNYEGFMMCWNELWRVLTNGGDCYIFPLGTQSNKEDFQRSLEDMKEKIGMRYILLNTYGQEVATFPEAYTMRIVKE